MCQRAQSVPDDNLVALAHAVSKNTLDLLLIARQRPLQPAELQYLNKLSGLFAAVLIHIWDKPIIQEFQHNPLPNYTHRYREEAVHRLLMPTFILHVSRWGHPDVINQKFREWRNTLKTLQQGKRPSEGDLEDLRVFLERFLQYIPSQYGK